MNNKRLAINMAANIFSFIVTMGINFILSPYLINTVGKEAYGFVGLANNFISYAQLITLALNSMAGRFITIKFHQGDEEGANQYFTSVIIANIITAVILLIPGALIILNLHEIVHIPSSIIFDVKILWSLVFVNFLIGLVLLTFNVSTFVVNRLDLSSIRDIQANFLRVVVLISAFLFFTPSVWYIGLASVVYTVFIGGYNIYYKKKLVPNLKFNLRYFNLNIIIELLYSGIWHVVIKLGQILSDGLDLLISNIFIDPTAMGILAIAKTVPSAMNTLLGTVTNVFSPQLTIYYARGDKERLLNELIKSMKFTGLFTNIPLTFLVAFGFSFYSLWVPGEDIELIHILSILTILGGIITGVINPLFNIFTITNRVKIHSFVMVINGFINVIIVYILLKTTNLGIFAIAGVSTLTSIIRNLIYTPIYSAHCLDVSKRAFLMIILRYILSSIILLMIFYTLSQTLVADNWLMLILSCFICGIIGLIINYIVLFDSKERKYFYKILLKRDLKLFNK